MLPGISRAGDPLLGVRLFPEGWRSLPDRLSTYGLTEKEISLVEASVEQVVWYFGEVRDGLRRIWRPIPENDLWIAATTLRYGLIQAA
jgi:predicted nucleic acid-binding protein